MKYLDSQHNQEILTAPIQAIIIKLAAPLLVGSFFQWFYNVADAFWISRIDLNDPSYVGAVGLAFPLFFIAVAFSSGFLTGISSFIARAEGVGQKNAYRRIVLGVAIIILILSAFFSVLSFYFAEPFFRFMGATGNYLSNCLEYYYYLLPSIILLFVGSLLIGILQGKGIVMPIMQAMLISTVSNIILDPVLIFTMNLGVKGAAIATGISQLIAIIYILFHVRFVFTKEKNTIEQIRFDWVAIKDVLSVGSSQTFSQVIIAVSALLFNYVIININPHALSAYAVCGRFDQFVAMPIIAISSVLITVIGQNYGSGNFNRMKKAWKVGNSLSIVVVFTFATIVFIMAPLIYSYFSSVKEVIDLSVLQTRMLVYSTIFVSINMLASAYFQSIAKPMSALLLSALRLIIIPLPIISFFLVNRNLTITNLWIIIIISNFVSAIISWVYVQYYQKNILNE